MVSVPAFGAVGQQVTVAINSIKAIVNGQEMTADRFVYKGRTYVQLKELTDMLGGELLWDKENNAAIATFNLNKPTEEVDPLPLKDIEESKPATEPQAEPQNRQPGKPRRHRIRNHNRIAGAANSPKNRTNRNRRRNQNRLKRGRQRWCTTVQNAHAAQRGFLLNRRNNIPRRAGIRCLRREMP